MSTVFRRNLQAGTARHAVEVREKDGAFTATVDGTALDAALRPGAELGTGREVLFDGPAGPERAVVARDGDTLFVHLRGRVHRFPIARRKASGGGEADEGGDPYAESPMTGVVLKMLATPGAAVAAGAPLFVIEAMKMEFVVEAPRDVVVASVDAAAGDRVDIGQVLVRFADGPADSEESDA